ICPCRADSLAAALGQTGGLSRWLGNVPEGGRVKVLVLTNLYPPHYVGGDEVICHTVVTGLRRRGHEVGGLTSNHQVNGVVDECPERQVSRTLRIHGLYGHSWLGIQRLQRLEQHNNQTFVAALKRFRPDLVYVWNMGGLSKSMLFTLEKSGLPT